MPSRKLTDHCEKCGSKNHLRAKFCNNCGAKLSESRAKQDNKGRMKLHADIAHPINADCRKKIQDKIIVAFKEELEKSKEPDYKPPADIDEPNLRNQKSLITNLRLILMNRMMMYLK
jgi:stage V sporulation protein G